MCPHHHHCHGSHHRLSPLVVRHRLKHLMALFSDGDVDSDEYYGNDSDDDVDD